MKTLLISTDLVMKQDGTFTPTEINTNTGHDMRIKNKDIDSPNYFTDNFSQYVNHVEFNQFLQDNSITKIKTIDVKTGFHRVIEAFSRYYTGYTYELVEVLADSTVIPNVDDADDTIIIRIAYDSFALVDDLYARDNYEFHNLIKNETFASKVTFNTGDENNLDTISTFEPSIDGVVPNYVVKRRTPSGGTGIYPRIYRLENEQQLIDLKQSISEDEFIQKYEYNSDNLVDNRTSFIRSVDILYGPELSIFNFLNYKLINSVSTQNNVLLYDNEVTDNNQLTELFATKYYPKVIMNQSLNYHFDETDTILLPDDTIISATDLVIGDVIKVVQFNEEILNYQQSNVENLNTFTVTSASVGSINEKVGGIFINLTAIDDDGVVHDWYDGLHNFYLVQDSNEDYVQYVNAEAGEIEIGDRIYVYNKISNSMSYLTIQSISFDIKNIKTYLISLEDKKREFFMSLSDNLFLIQHNAGCDAFCGVYYTCARQLCGTCSKSNPGCPNCRTFYSSYLCNSDNRLKENIILISKSPIGINIYQFNYIGKEGLYEGVIAQELLGTEFESALCVDENGMYMVDYSKLDVEFKKIN